MPIPATTAPAVLFNIDREMRDVARLKSAIAASGVSGEGEADGEGYGDYMGDMDQVSQDW